MQTKMFFLAVAALTILAIQVLRGDALEKVSTDITGTIYQASTTGPSTVKPITIANMLGALGIVGSGKDLSYYNDTTTSSIVIAPKTLTVSGSGTPTATVFTFSNSPVTVLINNHSSVASGDATGLAGNLSGSEFISNVSSQSTTTQKVHFSLFGTISGLQTIMKGTIVSVYPNAL